jgi:hypothetical protein
MAFNLYEIGPACVAGVAFYVSLYHIVLYFQTKRTRRVYLTFGCACVGIGLYDISCLGKYTATNIIEGASWQRFNYFVGPIIVLSLLWFFFDYTSYRRRELGYVFALYFIATSVIGLVGPVEYTLNVAVPMVKIIQVTPSLQIIYYVLQMTSRSYPDCTRPFIWSNTHILELFYSWQIRYQTPLWQPIA